ncbi:MAG: hypothetical protein GX887_07605 [Firmicutes bacterium]|nr:hypothetical protein [Bacillota bacterium]
MKTITTTITITTTTIDGTVPGGAVSQETVIFPPVRSEYGSGLKDVYFDRSFIGKRISNIQGADVAGFFEMQYDHYRCCYGSYGCSYGQNSPCPFLHFQVILSELSFLRFSALVAGLDTHALSVLYPIPTTEALLFLVSIDIFYCVW